MKTPYLTKYSLVNKFRCGICNSMNNYGTWEFDSESDMKTHMLKHCKHLNVTCRIRHGNLNMLCNDCSCSFGITHLINEKKQAKFELKNPQDLMEYANVLESLGSDQIIQMKLIKHMLYLQKSWGFFKTKEKIKKMNKKELVGVC